MAEGTIGLAEPSTITKSLRTFTHSINSSAVHQELMGIAGAGSSLQIAAVVAAAPASTEYGLVVRIAGGPSSAVDLQARVNQGLGNSSLADAWQVRSSPQSTLWASSAGFHFDSSGALQITGASASTQVSLGLPTMATVALSTVGNTSTGTALISSAATTPFITSYVVTSTETGPLVCGFYAGSTLLWPVIVWADGGVPTQMQGPSVPPSYIFAGQAGRPVQFTTPSSAVTINVALTYFNA